MNWTASAPRRKSGSPPAGRTAACPYVTMWVVRAGGVERDVSFAQAPPEVQGDIDAAYHAKYDRYGPRIVGSVTGPGSHAVTVRLVSRPGKEK
jgi:hypothetical protein